MNRCLRYRESHLELCKRGSNLLDSWVGSVNAFLVTGCGLIAGILYDRGYLYVSSTSGVVRHLILMLPSYYLLIGGSLLQSFALFMLSLTQPGQYYQVCHHANMTGYCMTCPTDSK